MSLNHILPKTKEILRDDDSLWYFKKEDKEKLLNYLSSCSLEDLKDTTQMGEIYLAPTWYFLLNDYDVAKALISRKDFYELSQLNAQEYKDIEQEFIEESSGRYGYRKITNLTSTVFFTPNIEVIKLLKNKGVQFEETINLSSDFFKVSQIIKAGIFNFNEDKLIANKYQVGDTQDSIIQEILFSYNVKKESTKDLINMGMAINEFVDLGCKTAIKYKSIETASTYFISEEGNYKEIIKKYCPDLHEIMNKIEFAEKMQLFPVQLSNKNEKKITNKL